MGIDDGDPNAATRVVEMEVSYWREDLKGEIWLQECLPAGRGASSCVSLCLAISRKIIKSIAISC